MLSFTGIPDLHPPQRLWHRLKQHLRTKAKLLIKTELILAADCRHLNALWAVSTEGPAVHPGHSTTQSLPSGGCSCSEQVCAPRPPHTGAQLEAGGTPEGGFAFCGVFASHTWLAQRGKWSKMCPKPHRALMPLMCPPRGHWWALSLGQMVTI